MTLFRLVYGKSCHLLKEIDQKDYWLIKSHNLDARLVREKMKLQLNELDGLRVNACENAN